MRVLSCRALSSAMVHPNIGTVALFFATRSRVVLNIYGFSRVYRVGHRSWCICLLGWSLSSFLAGGFFVFVKRGIYSLIREEFLMGAVFGHRLWHIMIKIGAFLKLSITKMVSF